MAKRGSRGDEDIEVRLGLGFGVEDSEAFAFAGLEEALVGGDNHDVVPKRTNLRRMMHCYAQHESVVAVKRVFVHEWNGGIDVWIRCQYRNATVYYLSLKGRQCLGEQRRTHAAGVLLSDKYRDNFQHANPRQTNWGRAAMSKR